MQRLDVPAIRRLVSYVLEHNPAMFFDFLVALQTQDLPPRPLHLCTGFIRCKQMPSDINNIQSVLQKLCSNQTRGDSTFNDSDSDSDSSTPFRFRLRFQSSWLRLRFRLQHYFYERFRLRFQLRFRFNSDSSTPYILIVTPELYKF